MTRITTGILIGVFLINSLGCYSHPIKILPNSPILETHGPGRAARVGIAVGQFRPTVVAHSAANGRLSGMGRGALLGIGYAYVIASVPFLLGGVLACRAFVVECYMALGGVGAIGATVGGTLGMWNATPSSVMAPVEQSILAMLEAPDLQMTLARTVEAEIGKVRPDLQLSVLAERGPYDMQAQRTYDDVTKVEWVLEVAVIQMNLTTDTPVKQIAPLVTFSTAAGARLIRLRDHVMVDDLLQFYTGEQYSWLEWGERDNERLRRNITEGFSTFASVFAVPLKARGEKSNP